MRTPKHATSERILAAAAGLFATNAYGEISVDEIAREAGTTKVTVYQHFGSKERLFLDCLRMRLERREAMLDRFFEQLPERSDPLLALFGWLEGWLDPRNFKGCAFVKAVNELSATVPEVRAIAADAKRRIGRRITALAQSSGRPRPAELAQELALIFEGAQSLALIEASARPARIARRIAEGLLK
ncbi:MAG TPA: TetR/AcrR family transcriptional regulator [Steroidobacteraceae bacterium]|nr:TetR/AcrR family transcriptional regulator [Steroidobacteraceae bacterium]